MSSACDTDSIRGDGRGADSKTKPDFTCLGISHACTYLQPLITQISNKPFFPTSLIDKTLGTMFKISIQEKTSS